MTTASIFISVPDRSQSQSPAPAPLLSPKSPSHSPVMTPIASPLFCSLLSDHLPYFTTATRNSLKEKEEIKEEHEEFIYKAGTPSEYKIELCSRPLNADEYFRLAKRIYEKLLLSEPHIKRPDSPSEQIRKKKELSFIFNLLMDAHHHNQHKEARLALADLSSLDLKLVNSTPDIQHLFREVREELLPSYGYSLHQIPRPEGRSPLRYFARDVGDELEVSSLTDIDKLNIDLLSNGSVGDFVFMLDNEEADQLSGLLFEQVLSARSQLRVKADKMFQAIEKAANRGCVTLVKDLILNLKMLHRDMDFESYQRLQEVEVHAKKFIKIAEIIATRTQHLNTKPYNNGFFAAPKQVLSIFCRPVQLYPDKPIPFKSPELEL